MQTKLISRTTVNVLRKMGTCCKTESAKRAILRLKDKETEMLPNPIEEGEVMNLMTGEDTWN